MDLGSAGNWASIISVGIAIIGVIGGGSWWMAKMYLAVQGLKSEVQEAKVAVQKVGRVLRRHRRGSEKFHEQAMIRIDTQEARIDGHQSAIENLQASRHRPTDYSGEP